MGQSKHEKHFMKALNQRELQPSAESWDKLQRMLEDQEKSSRPVFWWLGIAATLVGGMFIAGILFFNNLEITPVIVDGPDSILQDEDKIPKNMIKEEIASEEAAPSNIKSKNISQEEGRNIILPKKEMRLTSLPFNNSAEKSPEIALVSESTAKLSEETITSQKLEYLISETSLSGNESIQPDEIDALLLKAVEEINQERQRTLISSNIDPQDLLYEVEMELEQSFREKIFEVLKDGYLKARTAVANRNN